jgi:hypothetical protein
MSDAEDSLSPGERAAVLAEYDRLAAEPVKPNYSSSGCGLMVLATVLFVVVPKLMPGMPRWGVIATLVFVIALILAGIVVYVFGGGGYARTKQRIDAALAVLSSRFGMATAEEKRNAAVMLIYGAVYSDSPGMSSTFDFDAARAQLGRALPYVEQVERLLIAERQVYPIFTAKKDAASE